MDKDFYFLKLLQKWDPISFTHLIWFTTVSEFVTL